MLYFHEERKLSNGQLWKVCKQTALIELCSFFIDIIQTRQIMPRVGFCFPLSTRGPEICTEKLSPGWGFQDGKVSGSGVSGGGGGDGNRSN